MNSPNTHSARAALDAVRPLLVRLDERRHPEDAAADLIEGWSGVETALRAMAGGSSLGGQALVSDVRAAGLLDYPHAHALLGFLAARDRATRPDYHPTGEDVAAARSGFRAIEAANGVGIAANTDTHPTPTQIAPPPPPPLPSPPRRELGGRDGRDAAATLAPAPAGQVLRPAAQPTMRPGSVAAPAPPRDERYEVPTPRGRRSPLLWAALAALLLGVGLGGWYLFGRASALTEGSVAYQAGRREAARRAFDAAVRADPEDAMPHVYLGRMAREDGDFARATSELTAALNLEGTNAAAAREMGSVQLAQNRPDLAVKFYTRALEGDGADRLAAGGMACALTQQGNAALARNFFNRAGSGWWDSCRQMAPGGALPGAALQGGAAPGGLAPGVPRTGP